MMKAKVSGWKFEIGDLVSYMADLCDIDGRQYKEKENASISGRSLTIRQFEGRKQILDEMYIIQPVDPPICRDGSRLDESIFIGPKDLKRRR